MLPPIPYLLCILCHFKQLKVQIFYSTSEKNMAAHSLSLLLQRHLQHLEHLTKKEMAP